MRRYNEADRVGDALGVRGETPLGAEKRRGACAARRDEGDGERLPGREGVSGEQREKTHGEDAGRTRGARGAAAAWARSGAHRVRRSVLGAAGGVRRGDGAGAGGRDGGGAHHRGRARRIDAGDRRDGPVDGHGAGCRRRRRGRRGRRLLLARAAQRGRDPHRSRRSLSSGRVHPGRAGSVESERPEPASRRPRAGRGSRYGAAAAHRGGRLHGGPRHLLRGDAAAPRCRRDGHRRRPPGRRAGHVLHRRPVGRDHRPVRFPELAQCREGHRDRRGRHRARHPDDTGRREPGRRAGVAGRRRDGPHRRRAALHGSRRRRERAGGARRAGTLRRRRRDRSRHRRGRRPGPDCGRRPLRGGTLRHLHGDRYGGNPYGHPNGLHRAARRGARRAGRRSRPGPRPPLVGPVGLGGHRRPGLRHHRDLGRRRAQLFLGT